jgi:glyoxylase-like metal-dependent hydrolase (beta-lactamase superfamily II)
MIRVEPHGDVVHFRMARTVFGRALYWTGAYVVDGLLVDCGPPALSREVLRTLEGHRLVGLVLTHHHEDHTGNAGVLRERRGLVPRIHPAGVPLLRHGFPTRAYRRLVWGAPRRADAEPLGEDVRGASLAFQVLHTPGHSEDHVCLFQPERGWLFTGDLFLAERLRYLRSDEDLERLVASLEAVARLPLREVFCAHRGLVRDGPAALRRKAENLKAVRETVIELMRGGLPEDEITRRVVGRESWLSYASRGDFSARNFVRAVARGRAEPGG